MQDIVNSPGYLAYKFNFETENVEFLPIDAADIRRVSALKHEYIDPTRQLIPVPLSKLTDLLTTGTEQLVQNPPRFIFHTAFCASTFLSRCLDVEGTSTALREPQILLDAANAKRLQWRARTAQMDYRGLAKLALILLQKHTRPSETLVIKPINSVNNIIGELLKISAGSRALLLYTDARNFMLSTLRKGEGGKHVVRAMFDLLRCDFPHLANLSLSAMIHMTDWNIILTFWRLQTEQAEQMLQQHKNAMASLYGEELIHDPLASVQQVNRFLELGLNDKQIDTVMAGDQRHQDAKASGQRFSVEKREETYHRLEEFYGVELEQVFKWMLRNNPATELQPRLSSGLR
jgi:hypothetical protein